MKQEKIWDYLQNEDARDEIFPEARQRYMLSYLKPGMAVLDIGVGSGALVRLGKAKGVIMHALDPSERAIDRLRAEFDMGTRAHAGYAQAMPFGDASFDAVVMSEVLEHLDDAVLAGSLDEVRRVLKPGGFLLASTPYREDLNEARTICPSCGSVFHKYGHMQSFDRPRFEAMLKLHKYGQTHIHIASFVDWKRKGVRNFVKSVARYVLARMGEAMADPHLVVIAHRG
jgi:ubiquinone/menaquinone biosynthesis C-methylase UbiE